MFLTVLKNITQNICQLSQIRLNLSCRLLNWWQRNDQEANFRMLESDKSWEAIWSEGIGVFGRFWVVTWLIRCTSDSGWGIWLIWEDLNFISLLLARRVVACVWSAPQRLFSDNESEKWNERRVKKCGSERLNYVARSPDIVSYLKRNSNINTAQNVHNPPGLISCSSPRWRRTCPCVSTASWTALRRRGVAWSRRTRSWGCDCRTWRWPSRSCSRSWTR